MGPPSCQSKLNPFDYKAFDPPAFPADKSEKYIVFFHNRFASVAGDLKRFSLEDMQWGLKRFRRRGKYGPEDFGYSSIEHVLFFIGCAKNGSHFTFDKKTALQRKAAIVAAHLGSFTKQKFEDTFWEFFRVRSIPRKGGIFTSVGSLLWSIGIEPFKRSDGSVTYSFRRGDDHEPREPGEADTQERANTSLRGQQSTPPSSHVKSPLDFDYKLFAPPVFPSDRKQQKLVDFHKMSTSFALKKKRFTLQSIRGSLSKVAEIKGWRKFGVKRIPEDFGYSSMEHLLFFQGCVQEGRWFSFDEKTAHQRQVAIVAAHLGKFTKDEFAATFWEFFRVENISLKSLGISSFDSLLESIPGIEAVSNDEGTTYTFRGDANHESENPSEIQQQTIPAPSDVMESDSSHSDMRPERTDAHETADMSDRSSSKSSFPSIMKPFDYKAFDPPNFPEGQSHENIYEFHKIFTSVGREKKRFSLADIEAVLEQHKACGKDEWIPEDFGYSSIEHVLFFRGCDQDGNCFTFDEKTALQRKAAIVAAHLGQFTEEEFQNTFSQFFHAKFRNWGLLTTVPSISLLYDGDHPDRITYTFRGDTNQESSEIQKIPVPPDAMESDSDDSDIEIIHEHIVTKKRLPPADEEEATFYGNGEPVVKKKKSTEEASPVPMDTFELNHPLTATEEQEGPLMRISTEEAILGNRAEHRYDLPNFKETLAKMTRCHHTVDALFCSLRRFTEEQFLSSGYRNFKPQSWGYQSFDHLFLMRGCVPDGIHYTYDERTATERKARILAANLQKFSVSEFGVNFRKFFTTDEIVIRRLGFDSLQSLLGSIPDLILTASNLYEVRSGADLLARTMKPTVDKDSRSKDDEVEVEKVKLSRVTKERPPSADEEEAPSDGDGEPVVKKKKSTEEASPVPMDTFGDALSSGGCPKKEMPLKRKDKIVISHASPVVLHNTDKILSGSISAMKQIEEETNSEGKDGQEAMKNHSSDGRQEQEDSNDTNFASEEANSEEKEEEVEAAEEPVEKEEDDSAVKSSAIPTDSEENPFHERKEKLKEIQKQTIPVPPIPMDVMESDSNDSDIEILHENIVTKKRTLGADEEEAISDGDGEPVVKKKKECREEAGDDNTNLASKKADSADEEEKEEDVEKAEEPVENEEDDSAVESSAIPTDPSEANPDYEHILNMGIARGQCVEKQVSEITPEVDQLIQKDGVMGGTDDPGTGCSTSQPLEADSDDSYDEALIERMNGYHNEFLSAVITGAMKKGVDAEELGKKVLDRIFD